MPTVLILGAGSDIAVALARRYAAAGFTLQLAGRNPEQLRPLEQDLRIRHRIAVTVHAFDALDFTSHAGFYRALPAPPDVVLCVFGYLGSQEKGQQDWQEASRILHTNFTGAVSILNIVAEDMAARGKGTIIGISSVAGDRGRMSNYLYGSAKAGFTAYLSGLRNRLWHSGAHVMTVEPGFVATQMTGHLALPALLTAQPGEVADDIFKAAEKKKNVLYTKWFWRYIMMIIKNIPEPIFKKKKL
ncbi:SDR family oxidoreductase [Chitinophaga rhizosphaerae]|uniref:SDR family oxidoreductase n=1 Tax=Chitinophaga rhizosphaerae TaxID=1864947 RepID=UPI000F7FD0B5|nr:SDR family oxidoreductase [Chitinophaga rhizosphaerae]